MAESKELLELQLSEVELLQSMYPEEMQMGDAYLTEDMQRYIAGEREATPRQLNYSITIKLTNQPTKIEVRTTYPLAYPEEPPEVFGRCQQMTRDSQKNFNNALQEHVRTIMTPGELCMSLVIMWIEDNAPQFIDVTEESNSNNTSKQCKYTGLARLWIYSHHIYRKELLKKIPESAKELDLTGFVLPGKPGIICVEGFKENCDIYWQRLKYPNWKHISCKHREEKTLNESTPSQQQKEKFCIFKDFQELAFEAHGDYGLRNDYHMDLGQFLEFLKQHKCEYMFNIFFGLEGKSAS